MTNPADNSVDNPVDKEECVQVKAERKNERVERVLNGLDNWLRPSYRKRACSWRASFTYGSVKRAGCGPGREL